MMGGWRSAWIALARDQPLNPTAQHLTHYAQGDSATGNACLGIWRKAQSTQGQTCWVTGVRGMGGEWERNAMRPAATPSASASLETELQ